LLIVIFVDVSKLLHDHIELRNNKITKVKLTSSKIFYKQRNSNFRIIAAYTYSIFVGSTQLVNNIIFWNSTTVLIFWKMFVLDY